MSWFPLGVFLWLFCVATGGYLNKDQKHVKDQIYGVAVGFLCLLIGMFLSLINEIRTVLDAIYSKLS